ncbi:MAG: 4-(cytidine 5'-diphospho)-2-C-methyl-D-erythritol kinase [Verrucomicrobiales bacterium]|nr:4-(cytidine 5'-diphospho)-2-C-methyl-D-erythritol kinase [Verrucomicrobiales bacterium]
MSDSFSILAPAKTNLSLRVLGKREDGFHEIETRMVPLTLADELTLDWTKENAVNLTCSDPDLPTGEENLATKAVRALEQRTGKTFSLKIHIEKQIPSGAGLGGGSSDAAAVLRAINEMAELNLSTEELAEVAAEVGSDVSFFVYGTVCDCRGRGEIVEPVEDFERELPVVLVKPNFEISAAFAYQNYVDSKAIPGVPYVSQICPWGEMVNDLERPVFQKHIVLARMKEWLLGQPEVHAALMSGSGSTMLAVLNRDDAGTVLAGRVAKTYGKPTWTWVGATSR